MQVGFRFDPALKALEFKCLIVKRFSKLLVSNANPHPYTKVGRAGNELIVCDLTGTGAQDAAIAEYAYTTYQNSTK